MIKDKKWADKYQPKFYIIILSYAPVAPVSPGSPGSPVAPSNAVTRARSASYFD